VGWVVGFHFDVFLLPGDDDVASVSANVDDIAEIGCGGVVKVARLMLLLLLRYALPAFGVFGIPEPAAFFLNAIFIFYLHGICGFKIMFR
jgi:hypothetical protein